MSLFSKTISSLENSLDYAALKNKTISNNIANVDTPGYKSQSVSFQSALEEQMQSTFQAKRTHPKHIPFEAGSPAHPFQIMSNSNTNYNNNGNNVDIDKEMSELAQNQIYYQGLVDRINGKFNSLQTVIKGGR